MDSNTCNALFKNSSALPELTYDLDALGNRYSPEYLARVIRTSYELGCGAYDEGYQKLIEEAMCKNNVQALSMLWDGIYYHDRDNPAYEFDLRTAAMVSNLETFKFVLHGFRNYATLHEMKPIPVADLMDLAEEGENDEVIDFLERMTETTLYPRSH